MSTWVRYARKYLVEREWAGAVQRVTINGMPGMTAVDKSGGQHVVYYLLKGPGRSYLLDLVTEPTAGLPSGMKPKLSSGRSALGEQARHESGAAAPSGYSGGPGPLGLRGVPEAYQGHFKRRHLNVLEQHLSVRHQLPDRDVLDRGGRGPD